MQKCPRAHGHRSSDRCPEPQGPPSAPEGHPRAGSAPGTPCCAREDPAHLCLPSDPPGRQTPRVGFGGTAAPAPPRRVGHHCLAPKGSTPTHPLSPHPSWLFSFATHFIIILNVQCLCVRDADRVPTPLAQEEPASGCHPGVHASPSDVGSTPGANASMASQQPEPRAAVGTTCTQVSQGAACGRGRGAPVSKANTPEVMGAELPWKASRP